MFIRRKIVENLQEELPDCGRDYARIYEEKEALHRKLLEERKARDRLERETARLYFDMEIQKEEIEKRRRLYRAGTEKMRAKLGEMGKQLHLLLAENEMLRNNLNAMTEAAGLHEESYLAAGAENGVLRERLRCYQGIERLLFQKGE